MFLEIDMPLAHEAAQPIHAAEVGGGLDGMVRLRHTCRSVGDGERGFVYVSASTATLHKDPSANSPIIATAPHGGRLLFRDTRRKDGIGWDYFNSAGRTGWVPLRSSAAILDGREGALPRILIAAVLRRE